MQTLTKNAPMAAEDIIQETASLPPKISTTVTLGIYEKAVPEPEFNITYYPEGNDDVKAMFVKVPEGHEYRLQCIFQNFTNSTYQAVITEKHV